MIPDSLNTNQIKDASGAEVQFQSLGEAGPRTKIFAKIGEAPSLPQRLRIQHSETGSGLRTRRRSVARFDIASVSDVDGVSTVTSSAYVVLDLPVGARSTDAEFKKVLAYLMSFVASDGSDTTVKYAGTGTGAAALLSGGL